MLRLSVCLFSLLLLTVVNNVTAGSLQIAANAGNGAAPSATNTPLVTIYTLSTCPHCKEAKDYFRNNNIAFDNREIDTDGKNMDDLMTIFDKMDVPEDRRGVPFIIIGDVKMQGFSKTKVQEALRKLKP
jgi:glutaredoxin